MNNNHIYVFSTYYPNYEERMHHMSISAHMWMKRDIMLELV